MIRSMLITTRRLTARVVLFVVDRPPPATGYAFTLWGCRPSLILVTSPHGSSPIWPASTVRGGDSAWTGSAFVTTPAVRVVRVVQGSPLFPTDNPGVAALGVPQLQSRREAGPFSDTVVVTDAFRPRGLRRLDARSQRRPKHRDRLGHWRATRSDRRAFTWPRPDIGAIYELVAREGPAGPDLKLAGGQIVLRRRRDTWSLAWTISGTSRIPAELPSPAGELDAFPIFDQRLDAPPA